VPIFKKVNKDFFKTWSPEMAYVLGFFAADGYMTLNKRGGHFWSIQINDRDLLEAIRDAVGSEHLIGVRTRSGNEHAAYRLQIGSKEMCDNLRKLGMQERKTKSLALPAVPDTYLSEFVRGYFDGDGNVWMGRMNKERASPNLVILTVFTSCSFAFLKQLQERLLRIGLNGGSLYKAKGSYARLQFSVSDSLKIYELMYNSRVSCSSKLFLKRKKEAFESYKKMRW